MRETSGVILAGGKGKRLGAYKAAMPLSGEPLILRPFRVLERLAEEVLIAHGAGRQRRVLEDLGLQGKFVEDNEEGPLGGLMAALEIAKGEWTLVAPCDAPLVSAKLYESLLSVGRGFDGSMVRLHGRENPVIAAYRRKPLLRAGRVALKTGERSLLAVITGLRLEYLEDEELSRMPFGTDSVLDVDQPEDLQRAEEILRGLP